ncbi:Hsp70 family protein [Candidatus Uabimicrobium sp. HlEnr_7]|uniref:Hsp70 family protein n=1 Tax=Candidatus Uabimicrobium helgolandensis TaxID=3095367 RepID=UPI0035578F31
MDEHKQSKEDLLYYNGLVSIDYGTTNTTVAARDVRFAEEEIRNQLSSQQWSFLCEWLDKHVSQKDFSAIFLKEVFAKKLETCQQRLDIVTEILCYLSSGDKNTEIHRNISQKLLSAFESIIYNSNLEEKRYFTLPLTNNKIFTPNTQLTKTTNPLTVPSLQYLLNQDKEQTSIRDFYIKIIERTIENINKRAAKGEFEFAHQLSHIILTLPTVYTHSFRRNLQQIFADMGIAVDTRFDTATAAALFYAWRETEADPICGQSGLFSRCRKNQQHQHYQNLLVYDLGGGTTSISIVRFTYKEIVAFANDEEKGKGGRWYNICPKVLRVTGHRYLGSNLITLEIFHFLKKKLANSIRNIILDHHISLPKECSIHTSHLHSEWNTETINAFIPTHFAEEKRYKQNFISLWEIAETLKKNKWHDKIQLDIETIQTFILSIHPWLRDMISVDNIEIYVTRVELEQTTRPIIQESLKLAYQLAKDIDDSIDRVILTGNACSLDYVQTMTKEFFPLTNVSYEKETAKTSAAVGACIGHELSGPCYWLKHTRTRAILRDGYDYTTWAVEEMFSPFPCRLAYDSLVSMISIVTQQDKPNVYIPQRKQWVWRTSITSLHRIQPAYWIYRIDFQEAIPRYLGLFIPCEEDVGLTDFRKFANEYVVGFEVDCDLFVRAFFLPKEHKRLDVIEYKEWQKSITSLEVIQEDNEDLVVTYDIYFNDEVIIASGTKLEYIVKFPNGEESTCAISGYLPITDNYTFFIQNDKALHFDIDRDDIHQAILACNEKGLFSLITSSDNKDKFWMNIEYTDQRIGENSDPFCGYH